MSAVGLTPDGRYGLLADNSLFGTSGHRVAVVGVEDDGLRAVQVLQPFTDPAALAFSPYGNAALVVALEDDAIHHLAYDPDNATAPFSITGEVAYTGGGPLLPGSAATITQGSLTGLVLVGENTAVRRLRFEEDGSVTDLGTTSMGEGMDGLAGAMGVQP